MPEQPDEAVAHCDCYQCERDPDAEEVFHRGVKAGLIQKAHGRDVGGGADRGEITAECRTGKEAEVEKIRLDAKASGGRRDNGKHGRDIGNVIYKCGDQDGSPDNDRVKNKEVVSADRGDDVRYPRPEQGVHHLR